MLCEITIQIGMPALCINKIYASSPLNSFLETWIEFKNTYLFCQEFVSARNGYYYFEEINRQYLHIFICQNCNFTTMICIFILETISIADIMANNLLLKHKILSPLWVFHKSNITKASGKLSFRKLHILKVMWNRITIG